MCFCRSDKEANAKKPNMTWWNNGPRKVSADYPNRRNVQQAKKPMMIPAPSKKFW